MRLLLLWLLLPSLGHHWATAIDTLTSRSWPDGTFALPATRYGCPDGADWSEATLKFPRKIMSAVDFSTQTHLRGPFVDTSVSVHFCVRQQISGQAPTETDWPAGNYCIFGAADDGCPVGFKTRLLYLPTPGVQSDGPLLIAKHQAESGRLSLTMCCRGGETSEEMILPAARSIYLIQNKADCPSIEGMAVEEEYSDHVMEFMTSESNDASRWNATHCFYSPIVPPDECYKTYDRGASYRGTWSTTVLNTTCWPWTPQSPRYIYPETTGVSGGHNYCRNTKNDEMRPWCHAREFDSRTTPGVGYYTLVYCDVPKCNITKGRNLAKNKGVSYSGQTGVSSGWALVDENPGTCLVLEAMILPWMQINLLGKYRIDTIIIERTLVFSMLFDNLDVYVSDRPDDFHNGGALTCTHGRSSAMYYTLWYDCIQPVHGTYVTIQSGVHTDQLTQLALCDVEILGEDTGCGRMLGMAAGEITRGQLSVSSSMHGFDKNHARLYNSDAWCAESGVDEATYFQIDLLSPVSVEGLAIQGYMEPGSQQWNAPEVIHVLLGDNEDNLLPIVEYTGKPKEFSFGIDSDAPHYIFFGQTVQSRFVRVVILEYVGAPCMRLDVIGCRLDMEPLHSIPYIEDIDYPFVNTSVGQGCHFPFVYKGKKHGECVLEDILWCSLTENFDKDQQRAQCIVETYGGTGGGASCHFPFEYWGKIYSSCSVQPWDKEWCAVESDQLEHWGYCYGEKTCDAILQLRELPCGWSNITDTECTDIKCCPVATDSGFSCMVKDIECGVQYQSWEGYIYSPNHPYYYGQERNCWWELVAPADKVIHLDILSLDLASPDHPKQVGDLYVDSGNCADYLAFYEDQHTPTRRELRRFEHGDSFDVLLIAGSSHVSVEFQSCSRNSLSENQGFSIYVSFEDCTGCKLGSDTCSGDVQCGGECGHIASANFPVAYEANQQCDWLIVVAQDRYIELEILDFDVNGLDTTCKGDFLDVFDIDLAGTDTLIGHYCNRATPPAKIFSSWNKIHIQFESDIEGTGRGFHMKYRATFYSEDIVIDPPAGTECRAGWQSFSSSCYGHFKDETGVTWLEAEKSCQQNDGHLVSITSEAEGAYLHHMLTTEWMDTEKDIHIGLTDSQTEGMFYWTDGSPAVFTAWQLLEGSNQPDGLDIENCVHIRLKSRKASADWNDIPCSYNAVYRYVCEINNSSQHTEPALLDMMWQTNISCPAGHYKCHNGECIVDFQRCDSQSNCRDGSDEVGCLDQTPCENCMFKCDSGQHVPFAVVCDFHLDCIDGSDERQCVYPSCQEDEFQCDNQQCIQKKMRCDLIHDCIDGTDESRCESECLSDAGFFQCYSGQCIPKRTVCDAMQDCPGVLNEDESGACVDQRGTSCLDWRMNGFSQDGLYNVDPDGKGLFNIQCDMSSYENEVVNIFHHIGEERTVVNGWEPAGLHFWPIEYLEVQRDYDRIVAVVNSSDHCEQHLRHECKGSTSEDQSAVGGQWHKKIRFSRYQWNDGCECLMRDICDTSDRTGCLCLLNLATHWYEDSGYINDTQYLPLTALMMGDTGGEAEMAYHTVGPLRCYQEYDKSKVKFPCNNGEAVSPVSLCLNEFDKHGYSIGCRDSSHLLPCDSFVCPEGFVKCPGSYCIPVRMACDGKWNCINGEDEGVELCGNFSCPGHYRCEGQHFCIPLSQRCDGIYQCPEHDDERWCDNVCPSSCKCHGLTYRCEDAELVTLPADLPVSARVLSLRGNSLDMDIISFSDFTLLLELDMSLNHVKILPPNTFEKLVNLRVLDLGYNEIAELLPGTFTGLNRLVRLNLEGNLQLETIQSGSFIGLHSLSVLDLTGLHIPSLPDGVFRGMDSVQDVSLASNRIGTISTNAFVSVEAMLKKLDISGNPVASFSAQSFTRLTSLTHMTSDHFKFCCFVDETVSSDNCYPPKDEISSCKDLMSNETLRIFLWIFGFSALLGNSLVVAYRLFSGQSETVNGYFVCNLAVSDLVMGVYMIIIASVDMFYRGVYVEYESEWRGMWLCSLCGFIATMSSEASVFTLCLITIDRAICVSNPFSPFRITKRKGMIYILAIWGFSCLIAAIPLFPIGYFDKEFYGRSGVCVSLHLTSTKTPGWEYSAAIFGGLNFAAFLVILLGYMFMYCAIKSSTKAAGNKKSKQQELKVARKMTLIIMTDFVCWAPIFIMTLMAVIGNSDVPGVVYAWTIVFILPVNSALNPWLYTLGDIRVQSMGPMRYIRRRFGFNRQTEGSISMSFSDTQPMVEDFQKSHLLLVDNSWKPNPVGLTPLSTYLKRSESSDLAPADALRIAVYAARSINVAHSNGYTLPDLSKDSILVSGHYKGIQDMFIQASASVCYGPQWVNKDMENLGNLVKSMLRLMTDAQRKSRSSRV